MGTLRGVVVGLCCVGSAMAQAGIVLNCKDVGLKFAVTSDAEGGTAAGQVINRFTSLAALLMTQQTPAQPANRQMVRAMGDGRLAVFGTVEQRTMVTAMLEQLRKDPLVLARLQCSLVTLPTAAAKELAPAAGTAAPMDEATFGKLAREATKQKGTLQNLPEVVFTPLAPFVMEPVAKKVRGNLPAPDAQSLRVRGEMVPLSRTELAVDLQLVRGALPADLTVMPKEPLLRHVVRIEAGQGIAMVTVVGEQTTVVYVRCTEVTEQPVPLPPPPPAQPTPPRDKR